ncbi:MAG: hypothetical protein R3F18_02330 [Lysobacterales bacterium]
MPGEGSDTGAIDLAEPGTRVIYAAMWQTRRTPWNIYPPANGPGSGPYKSSDGGDSWQQIVGNGFPDKVGRIGVGILPAHRSGCTPSSTLTKAACTDPTMPARWRRSSADIRLWQRGWYFGRVTIDPANADIVYVLNTIKGVSTTAALASPRTRATTPATISHEMWIDPEDSNRQDSWRWTRARSSA